MSKIVRIVVHCTGEPANAKRNYQYYSNFFFNVKKWKHFGYHAIVYQDGRWETLQPWPEPFEHGGIITDATMANGAQGFNRDSLHIAYVGGLDPRSGKPADTRTVEQKKTLRALIGMWAVDYKVTDILGHSQLPNVHKACPCFDAKKCYSNG